MEKQRRQGPDDMSIGQLRVLSQEKYTNAFLGFGPEGDRFFSLELTYNYGALAITYMADLLTECSWCKG